MHCSWERPFDIQRLDASNNTARNKIRRFYQSQEVALGLEWKRVVEEERATAAKIHSHGGEVEGEEADQGEEYFPIQCLEIERILSCDESEMNMSFDYSNVKPFTNKKTIDTSGCDAELLKATSDVYAALRQRKVTF